MVDIKENNHISSNLSENNVAMNEENDCPLLKNNSESVDPMTTMIFNIFDELVKNHTYQLCK